MGTIFRTAEGAGVDGIFMSANCVDIYNPKTIRSTMGSIYRVPFVIAPDLQEVFAWFKKQRVRSYAAHLKGKGWYDEKSYTGGTAFLIGNEGNGLTDANCRSGRLSDQDSNEGTAGVSECRGGCSDPDV